MTNSWTGDVDSGEDSDPDFAERLRERVAYDEVASIDVSELSDEIDEVDDVELLEKAYEQADSGGLNNHSFIIEDRLDTVRPDDEPVEDDDEEDEAGGGSEAVVESVEEMTDESPSEEIQAAEEPVSAISEQSDMVPQPEGGMSVEEAAELDRRWKILVWGPAGLFKSHFAHSAPEPIAYIDTEGKAQDIAEKFVDKKIHIWQPENYWQTAGGEDSDGTVYKGALHQALDWLEEWHEQEGERGTIVVDSISLVWEWCKNAYIEEAYPMTDNDEVTLSSNMGNSQESDWKYIKRMHNDQFRRIITSSEFHFIWTAMETEDYAAVMEDDTNGKTPMKPEGEKNNEYKADTVLRGHKSDDGNKVGHLTKSNFTDHLFMGLERPTFPKLRETIERIEEAEASSSAVDKSTLESDLGVDIIRTDPTING